MADAANVTKFRDGPGRDLTDVLVEGEFVDLLVQCKYGKNVVNIDLQVAVAGVRGPANRSRAAEFEYFVAIADPARNIVAKELFKARFQFADNDPRVVQLEELEPRIPLADVFKAPDYEIFIGFQLTEAELAWNRARRKN
ncbi:MAG: hypothetical protein HY057_12030 [Rhodospirillales bacterium]|nr:hypothetical protein [Rhodospirillales bacterium]